MTRLLIDCTRIQFADDGNTTYYGGVYKVNEETYNGHGNDRMMGGNWHDSLVDVIVDKCPELDFFDVRDIVSEHDSEKYWMSVSGKLITIDPV